MTKIQNEENRKNQILDIAEELFIHKGFDNTSINDILKKVGIAKGTLYYYFASKEEIMDVITNRLSEKLITRADKIANDKTIPVIERLLLTIMALNANENRDKDIIDYVNRPQNALMHQKMQDIMIKEIPPILNIIVKEGIEDGVFSALYPYESIEMIVVHVNTYFNHYSRNLTVKELNTKTDRFLYNIEILLGAKEGALILFKELLSTGGSINE